MRVLNIDGFFSLSPRSPFYLQGHHSNCQIEESLLPEYFGAMNAQVWNRTKNPLLWPNFIYRWTDDYKKGCEYIQGIKEYMVSVQFPVQ